MEVISRAFWRASDYPIEIAELRSVSKELARLLSEEERTGLTDYLAFHPECGDVMPGTGGVRKMRWKQKNKGKSSGLRVLYYFHDLNMPLFILAVYAKGEKLRPTKVEEQAMGRLVDELVRKNANRVRGAPQPKSLA